MDHLPAHFFDYYEFLDVAQDASPDEIQAAVSQWRERNNRERVYPDQHLLIERREARLAEAEHWLLDPERRAVYDELYTRNLEEDTSSLLWLGDKGFGFDTSDREPALTLPALARKFDTHWQQAQEAINDGRVERMLFFVGHIRKHASRQARYEALRQQVVQVHARLGPRHPDEMLESIIILCDQRIPPASVRINGEPVFVGGGRARVSPAPSVTLDGITARPDRRIEANVRIEHDASGRGCVFGYIWIEESWAAITSPSLEGAEVGGNHVNAARFELREGGSVELRLRMEPAQLLALTRPETHPLTLACVFQPGTAHERTVHCTLPIILTSIPAHAIFEPTHITLPTVRKGAIATGVSAVRNGGEAPLHAQVAACSDADVSAEASLAESGGEVRVRVDTRLLRPGKRYDKWVQLAADGDAPAPRLAVSGSLLPTAWQHIFVKQPLRDRLTLASGAALLGLVIGPLGFGAMTPALFWILCALLIVGVACGATNLLTRRILGHIQASGDTTINAATMSKSPILLVGGATAALMLILLLVSMDPNSRSVLFIALLTLLCGICGFFINEDLAIYPRKNAGTTSIVEQATPAAHSVGRVLVIIGGLCLGALAVFVAIQIIIALLPVIIAILVILALLAAL